VVGDDLLLVLSQRHEKTKSRCGESWCERVCIERHATGNEPEAARFARFSNTLSTIPIGSNRIGLCRRPGDTDAGETPWGRDRRPESTGNDRLTRTGLQGAPAEPTAPGLLPGARGVDRHAFLSDGQTVLAGTVFDMSSSATVG
jgi:hypothetical protein